MNSGFSKIEVRTWHLYFEGLLPNMSNLCELIHWKDSKPEEYLTLYKTVGREWGWCGRLLLSTEELQKKLHSVENEIWLFKTEGATRGFFEIDRSRTGDAEIVYLGLLPDEIGRGLGKIFLDAAVATASGGNNNRVWLHTCEFDHPKALEIYLKAGFKVSKETIEFEYYPVDFLKRIKKSR